MALFATRLMTVQDASADDRHHSARELRIAGLRTARGGDIAGWLLGAVHCRHHTVRWASWAGGAEQCRATAGAELMPGLPRAGLVVPAQSRHCGGWAARLANGAMAGIGGSIGNPAGAGRERRVTEWSPDT